MSASSLRRRARTVVRPFRAVVSVALLVGLVVGSLAGPALAADGTPYPPPPRVNVTTPGATITITGDDWGPDSDVEIVARDRSRGGSVSRTTARVGPDGRLDAPVVVPPSGPGSELVVEVVGADAGGEPRSETHVFAISSTAKATDALRVVPAASTGVSPAMLALLLSAATLGGWLLLRDSPRAHAAAMGVLRRRRSRSRSRSRSSRSDAGSPADPEASST